MGNSYLHPVSPNRNGLVGFEAQAKTAATTSHRFSSSSATDYYSTTLSNF